MPNAFRCDVDMLTANDDGSAPTAERRLLVVHTFEGRDLSAESMAAYQQSPDAGGSYTLVIDRDGRTARENDDEFRPWAAGSTGNRVGWHFSLAGQAAFSREQWLARTAQLTTLARVLAAYSKAYRIPLDLLDARRVAAGARGVCGHAEISAAWREVDHTDPGRGFPFDVVLDLARKVNTPVTPTPGPTPAGTDAYAVDARAQLTGSPNLSEYPGWRQLGGRTVVDALAKLGHQLGVPGFLDPDAPR